MERSYCSKDGITQRLHMSATISFHCEVDRVSLTACKAPPNLEGIGQKQRLNVVELSQVKRMNSVFKSKLIQGLVGPLALVMAWVASAPSAHALSGIRDTEIELMIREYSDPILIAAGLNPNSIEIYLLNAPSVNAFVTRTNSMYLHSGLLLSADRPAQVIGVIAHEAGHIAGGHVARIGDAISTAGTPMIVTMLLGLGAAIAGAPDAGMALMASGQHIAERAILRHSRVQESSADQAAVTYLEKTGQSARGLLEVTEKFRHMEVLSARNQNPYVRTHPLSSDRIAALSNRVVNSPYADIRETPKQLYEFDMMQAKLYAFLHRSDLTFRKYPTSNKSLPARYARAIAYFRDPDIHNAMAEINSLIAEQPNNPYFQELAGQILFESGRAAESIPYHRKSVELMPNAPLLRLNLAQALLADEDPSNVQEAINHLDTALRYENDNSFGWYQLAVAYERSNNVPLANLATAERHYYNRQMGMAIQFARRAQDKLNRGTPQWQRAVDIMQVAAIEQAKQNNR